MSGIDPLQQGADLMGPVVDMLVERVAHRVAELILDRLGHSSCQEVGEEELLDVEAAARYLSLSKSTIYKLSSSGRLNTVKMGTRSRFRRRDLNHYIKENHRSSDKIVELAAEARSRVTKRLR